MAPPPTTDAITVKALSHTYPATGWRQSQPALENIGFEVEPGEMIAILGPNGGGKTTLFRILATMLAPFPTQPGAAKIFDLDVVRQARDVRQQIGMVFQAPSLDGKLSAEENLRHQGHLYGLRGRTLQQRIDQGLAQFELTDRAREHVERFSGGMRRRVELAKAMLHQPHLLLMDEPATGLDPAGRRELMSHCQRLKAQGTTLALTTHLLDEAERCDRVAILDHGHLLAIDSPANLKNLVGGEVVTLEPTPAPDNSAENLARQVAEHFGPFDGDGAPRAVSGRVRFEMVGAAEMVADLSHELPGRIQRITLGQPTLEDVFLHLTGATFDAADVT
jgi:ABC-2 type transport system ATP-binding protein